MHMSRIWMTGCMALVLMVAGRWPVREELEGTQLKQRAWIALTSKYGINETVRQIERSARKSGLPVLARATPQSPIGSDQTEGESRVLVLGDEGGQTPVLQAASHLAPELPWKVLVRERPDGQTDVWMTDPDAMAIPEGVTRETLERVTALPQMLKEAIT